MRSTRKERLCEEPHIFIIERFLDSSVCMEIIKSFKSNLKEATVTDGSKHSLSEARTGKVYFLKQEDELNIMLLKKICDLFNWGINDTESVQIALYKKGELYDAHLDAFDDETVKRNPKGQRIITNLIYLNDVKQGGSTLFPKIGIKVNPKEGRLLSFENCIKNTSFLNPFSIHQSLPVEKGEKWIAAIWLRKK